MREEQRRPAPSYDHHHQQQQQQQPATPMAPPVAQIPEAADDSQAKPSEKEKSTPRSSSKNSNSSSDGPGQRQLRRTVRDLREDVEETQEEVSSLRLRMLWLMSQEVRRERQEASRQLIIQGFEPRAEATNYTEAAMQRDQFIKDLLERLLKTSVAAIQYTSSHSTSLEALSRISILTFQQPHYVAAIARATGATKYVYGQARVCLKRQQTSI